MYFQNTEKCGVYAIFLLFSHTSNSKKVEMIDQDNLICKSRTVMLFSVITNSNWIKNKNYKGYDIKTIFSALYIKLKDEKTFLHFFNLLRMYGYV